MATREPTMRRGGGHDIASQHLEHAIANVTRARQEQRWVDSSQELERWAALCRKQSQAYATMPTEITTAASSSTSSGSGGMLTAMFAAKRFGRGASVIGSEDSEQQQMGALQLKERVPAVHRLIEKEGSPAEQLNFLAVVLKHNKKGRVQHRLLAVTDQAVYNVAVKGDKCLRRIPLGKISLITASESAAQFVMHVPSEYDYHFSVPSRGYHPLDGVAASGAPLDGIVRALQNSYAAHASQLDGQAFQTHLPVRNMNDAGPLGALVKKKHKSVYGDGDAPAFTTQGSSFGGADDDDDDD